MPAYVAAYGDDALTIIDVTNPLAPTFAGSIQGAGAPPGGNWLDNPDTVFVLGNYAYVCAYADNALTIIDISNPTSPIFQGSIRGAGAPPGGNWLYSPGGVFVVGNYAYVTAINDDALTIIDVTNPLAPAFAGSIQGAGSPNFLDRPNGVFVVGNYAYVAAVNDNSLTIIDVTNPLAPAFASNIAGAGAPPGGNWLGGALAVYVEGNYAYVGAASDNALTIIDITNPLAPTFAGSIQGAGAPPGGNWLGIPYGVFVLGNYAYVAAYTDNALTIIDITNPLAPTFVGSIQGAGAPNFLGSASSVHVLNGYAYVAAAWCTPAIFGALTIINVTNPLAPTFAGSIQGAGAPNFLDGPSSVMVRIAAPTVTTQEMTDVEPTTATGNGNVTNLGGESLTQHGHCWSTSHNPTTSDNLTELGVKGATGAFTSSLTGLSPNTLYYCRAYATNSAGTSYGSEVSFTTEVDMAEVTTDAATNVKETSATLNGTLDDDGGEACSCRFQYGFDTDYGTNTDWQSGKETGDTFSQAIAELVGGTLYHFRAQARNSAGTVNGNDRTLTTITPFVKKRAHALAREEL